MSQDEKTPGQGMHDQPSEQGQKERHRGQRPEYQSSGTPETGEKPESSAETTHDRAGEAAEQARTAAMDSLNAFKGMMLNPVAGLGATHDSLDDKRVLGVGVVFGLVAAFGMALAGAILVTGLAQMMMGMGIRTGFQFGTFFRGLIANLVGITACAGSIYMLAPVFGGRAKLGSSAFIAGATFLPWGLALFLGAIIGAILSNRLGMILVSLLVIFGLCYLIQILNAGFRQIAGLDEHRAAMATPSTLAVTAIIIMLIGWLLR